jgi:DNA mismatch endonuclease (patch repair protein)
MREPMDNLTPEQRSYMMSRTRSTDTAPELLVRKLAHARGLRYRKHCGWLPGSPDLVFVRSRVVVFVDGDYWHGWRFPAWKEKLGAYWKQKIENNRRRDQRNFRRLRRRGWLVVRLWEHEVKSDPQGCINRIENAVRRRAVLIPMEHRAVRARPPRR